MNRVLLISLSLLVFIVGISCASAANLDVDYANSVVANDGMVVAHLNCEQKQYAPIFGPDVPEPKQIVVAEIEENGKDVPLTYRPKEDKPKF